MKTGLIIAGFILLALLLYIAWGDLNSKLIVIESETQSYLYDSGVEEPAPAGDPADLAPLAARLDQLERDQVESAETIARLELRVRQLETAQLGTTGKIVKREIVYFEFNQDTLDADERSKIDRLLYTIEDPAFVSLIGHADTSGDNQYNQWLSVRRAAAVKRHIDARLEATGQSDKLFISITGTGEESVVKATGDEIRERSNRIVEILVFQ